jgi:deoxyribose-phosphate aldolase
VTACGADFIKTSTGFASGGATVEDIRLLKEHVGEHVGIKASGGIRTLEDAELFLNLGATRLGASSIVKLARPLFEQD